MEGGDSSEEDEDESKEPPPEPTRFGWVQGVMVRPALLFFIRFNAKTAADKKSFGRFSQELSVCLVDPLHVKHLGRDLVPEAALDYCSSRNR